MDPTETSLIAFNNQVLKNPRWATDDAKALQKVAAVVSEQFALTNHVWISTSGSTSVSVATNKLVALSETSLLASAEAVNEHLQVSAKDIWLQILPSFHVGGLGIQIRASLSGSRVIQDFGRWQAVKAFQLLSEKKVTLASMVPTQVFDLVQLGFKAPLTLRAVVVGGGALTPSLYLKARSLGWPLLPSYGMTETCSQIATAALTTLQSLDCPLPQKLKHCQWRVSEQKVLEVAGLSLLTCYGQLQLDGCIRGWDPKQDGWFRSEDYVKIHGNEIQFLGRHQDFIKIGGEGSSMARLREIFDRSVASVLSEAETSAEDHPISTEIVLVDAPSQRLGTEIHLVHSSAAGQALPAKIKEKYNAEVLPFEKIREVKSVSKIPRSDLGKVLWANLKKELYGN